MVIPQEKTADRSGLCVEEPSSLTEQTQKSNLPRWSSPLLVIRAIRYPELHENEGMTRC
jgi:hypothetical protein